MSVEQTSSPSLLDNLRHFRRVEKSYPKFRHGKPAADEDEAGPEIGLQQPSDTESPEVKPVRFKRIVVHALDSDSDDGDELAKPPPTPPDGFFSKEASLQFLEEAYPSVDKMVLQDALVKSKWEVEGAMAHLCEKGYVEAQPSSGGNDASGKRKMEGHLQEHKQLKKVKRSDTDDEDEDKYDEYDEDDNAPRDRVFDSDDSELDESDDFITEDKKEVLEFLSTATVAELRSMPNCSLKKAEAIVEQRPFSSWADLVEKVQSGKFLGTELLNAAQDVLHTRHQVETLMSKCLRIAARMEKAILAGATRIKEQPAILAPGLKLTAYQMVGLNWLMVMHDQKVNGILADEMGLGKTVQVIAFLAQLMEMGVVSEGPHLIIVPSSTMDNWYNELDRWCPSLRVATYYGHPDDRKRMRADWVRNGTEDIDVILTTYTVLNSSPEEKRLFRVLKAHYVILDEAHMLKNMTTQRYETLMRINAEHRILLTGTPLQNNLFELMSLLTFLMPNMFAGRKEELKRLFAKGPKQQGAESAKDAGGEKQPKFEEQQVAHARHIMKPFVLRRLKSEVLQDLPKKTEHVLFCRMSRAQADKYHDLVRTFSAAAGDGDLEELGEEDPGMSGMAMTMQLRKLANHPLLLRYHYTDDQLRKIAAYLAASSSYKDDNQQYIFEDLAVMSDYQIYQLISNYKGLKEYALPSELFLDSGKFEKMDEILPQLKKDGARVLIFSQFVIMLDVMEEYLEAREYTFVRLDGSTPVTSRQDLINTYNSDPSIFIFLLSTRAGGMGINLTAANTVIIHDIDFNPYNDKQAEDRCHRVGQTRDVSVMRLISARSIEEGIYSVAQQKLTLEREINNIDDNEFTDAKSVACLLKQALGLDSGKPKD